MQRWWNLQFYEEIDHIIMQNKMGVFTVTWSSLVVAYDTLLPKKWVLFLQNSSQGRSMGKFCHFAINLHLDLTCSGKEQGERWSRKYCFIENQVCAYVVLLCAILQPSQPFLPKTEGHWTPALSALGSVSAFNCDSLVLLGLFTCHGPSWSSAVCPICRIDCQTGT